MPEYKVKWEIDIDADNHEKAARLALTWIKSPTSQCHVFNVKREDQRNYVEIDLDERGSEGDDV